MTIDTEDLLNSIMASLDRIDYIKVNDLPNIDLYMDQVTTFMESQLGNTTRYPGEDKILTKTMINNYAKNDLMPPPVKKKYSKDHILLLVFIYYFKNILSISDIQSILNPLTEQFFGKKDGTTLSSVYEEIFSLEKEQVDFLKKDILNKFERAQGTFSEADDDKRQKLQLFAFACMLSFDVYVKKLLIEKMIDGFMDRTDEKMQKKKNKDV